MAPRMLQSGGISKFDAKRGVRLLRCLLEQADEFDVDSADVQAAITAVESLDARAAVDAVKAMDAKSSRLPWLSSARRWRTTGVASSSTTTFAGLRSEKAQRARSAGATDLPADRTSTSLAADRTSTSLAVGAAVLQRENSDVCARSVKVAALGGRVPPKRPPVLPVG